MDGQVPSGQQRLPRNLKISSAGAGTQAPRFPSYASTSQYHGACI
uniref:Uncharacterized protein n=1 Tax=Arundo donax TaxID=35708 RepID=A0A0A9CY84_ARUDO